MKHTAILAAAAVAAVCLGAQPSAAQVDAPETIDFAGGTLTITETPDYDKVLDFDGRELARDYQVFFDRIADVGGTDVAFFTVGPGGNACAPASLMVWQAADGEVKSQSLDEDCMTPQPAVSAYEVFFVPYLLPGASVDVKAWNPEEGLRLHGRIAYAPEPGTDWASFDADAMTHPLDLFRNEAIYSAAETLLGDELESVAMGLGTAGMPEFSGEGLLFARGCVPHACGGSDTFVVVDTSAQALFMAQQGEPTRFWPERGAWSAAAAALIPDDF